MGSPITPEIADELRRLALLPDADIDTSDIPEALDWSDARRGAFLNGAIAHRNYDVRALANWFLDSLMKSGLSVSNLSLNKLLYFAQERSLIERGIMLTEARIEAWDHGPVFREVYHAFKRKEETLRDRVRVFSVEQRKNVVPDAHMLADDERFLQDIVQEYGKLTASQLREMSHRQGSPWETVWRVRGQVNPGMEITTHMILLRAPQGRQTHG